MNTLKKLGIETLAVCWMLLLSSGASAELTGSDREDFIVSFIRGCIANGNSAQIIASFGGGNAETRSYCSCVAQVYAANVNPGDTAENMDPSRLTKIQHTSRDYCLAQIFELSD